MKKKSIGFHIGVIHRGTCKYFEKNLGALGLHRGMVHVLSIMNECQPVSQQFLSEKLSVDKANMTRILVKLEESGFVERTVDQEDRRSKLISLTDKGRDMFLPVEEIRKGWTEILSAGMTREERKTYLSLLLRSVENMNEYFRSVDND